MNEKYGADSPTPTTQQEREDLAKQQLFQAWLENQMSEINRTGEVPETVDMNLTGGGGGLYQLDLALAGRVAVFGTKEHYRSADVMNTEAVVNFTIRWRNDVKPGMWVRFEDEKWDISTLGVYGFSHNYLGLKASIAKGVSG